MPRKPLPTKMIALPTSLELTARDAAAEARKAREKHDERTRILLGYMNQIRAAHELGETSLITTCLTHEIGWLSRELEARGFEIETEVRLMHGQMRISWEAMEG